MKLIFVAANMTVRSRRRASRIVGEVLIAYNRTLSVAHVFNSGPQPIAASQNHEFKEINKPERHWLLWQQSSSSLNVADSQGLPCGFTRINSFTRFWLSCKNSTSSSSIKPGVLARKCSNIQNNLCTSLQYLPKLRRKTLPSSPDFIPLGSPKTHRDRLDSSCICDKWFSCF